MTDLTRRKALLAGAATTALAACGETTGPSVDLPATLSDPAPAPPAATPNQIDKAFIDGTELAAQIQRGETTATLETDNAIARAKAVNGQLNAIATEAFDLAKTDAADLPSGPFQGVPTFMKDLVDWKGTPTMFGSVAFKDNMAGADSPFAAKWRKAGVVGLGKSTTPEMGLISSTEPLVTGATRNPWDTTRIPGGSSGGAAALVAARVVPFAHASDGGGSIRIPASTCGLFGLKPSASRLVGRTGAPPPVDISVNHAVTLSVRDSEALFRVAEMNDGTYPPLPKIEPLSRKLKIGFALASATGSLIASDTIDALNNTAELCRSLGHDVNDVLLDIDGAKFEDDFLMYWAAGAAQFAADASRYSGKPISPEIVEPWTLGLAGMFQQRQSEMPRVIGDLLTFQTQYDSWFEDYDVLLTPVTGSPAVPIGEQAPDGDFDAVMESVTTFAAFTSPMNVAGAASMSVPLGWSPTGLPIGSMFSARKGDDALLFSLAYQLEAAKPWIDTLPPVHAG